jgi:hypothetical protein
MVSVAVAQECFAAALFDPLAQVPATVRASTRRRADRGFAVYRNNVIVSLINALAARFPVVRRLAGEDSFRRAARLYIAKAPPRSPVLLLYGETFPRLLRTLGREASIDYLADVGELEFARGRAYHAADAVPLGADAFAALAPAQLDGLQVELHPSVSLLKSRFPIVSAWEANQTDEQGPIERWRAEAALVARPFQDVEVRRLPPGGHAFLDALGHGATLAAAAEAAVADCVDFDLAENLQILIAANVVIRFVTAQSGI